MLTLTVRRFFCDEADCAKKTFVEQVPGLTRRHGRHTRPAEQVVASVAMALGGCAADRAAGGAGQPDDAAAPDPPSPGPARGHPRVLGPVSKSSGVFDLA
jgi:hypothetical protein